MKKGKGYASAPAVPPKKVAGSNPYPGPTIAILLPKIVPTRMTDVEPLGGAGRQFGRMQTESRGYGHGHRLRQGNVRLSGNPSAHRIGKK